MKKPLKILVVDDNLDILELVGLELVHYGYDVDAVSSSAEACDSLDGASYDDVVISDISMPGVNGLQFAGILKSAKVPSITIAMTGESLQQECREAGFKFYLQKPFSPDELVGMIESARRAN